jgi:putative inorganic carbon (HCO3(-)) transporter
VTLHAAEDFSDRTDRHATGSARSGSTPGLNWYLVFIVSWFLHLPARIPFLGLLRADLVLVVILGLLAMKKSNEVRATTRTGRLIMILVVYAILTFPFVEWPGSVLKSGLPNLIKAAIFYYFTLAFVRTERDLRRFILVLVVCQVLRILEPVYLNLAYGYWGSAASMSGGTEFLQRLSGSPSDVVNPNGLAWVICTVLPFLYFMQHLSWKHRLAFFTVAPICLHALALTGSRSGVIAFAILFVAILIKSRRRVLLLAAGTVAIVIGYSNLSPDMQDRYLSIFGEGDKNAATAEQRVEAMDGQFRVAMRRPILGHGLGTSTEANFHFNDSGPYAGLALPAHNLYIELIQEIGLVGFVIFILLMFSIISDVVRSARHMPADKGAFLPKLVDILQVLIVLNVVFSFASYGLCSNDWYLLGAMAVVLDRLRTAGTLVRVDHSVEQSIGDPSTETPYM